VGEANKQANNIYSAKINTWIKGTLRPGDRTGNPPPIFLHLCLQNKIFPSCTYR